MHRVLKAPRPDFSIAMHATFSVAFGHFPGRADQPRPAPGSVWTELPRPVSAGAEPVGHVRLGYARASTARQSLDA
jgi:hypothetical protein